MLTGFLGAGKTSLLNRLIVDPALADTAVIINEFGEVGLDHLLVKPITDGMVCCCRAAACAAPCAATWSTRSKACCAISTMAASTFRRVVLETTGLADPAPVLQTAMAHPYLVMRYRLDGVITVVDAVNGAATLDAHMEAVKQVAVADRIVLTKTDLVDTPERRGRKERLRATPARAQSGRRRCSMPRRARRRARTPRLRPVRSRPQDSRRRSAGSPPRPMRGGRTAHGHDHAPSRREPARRAHPRLRVRGRRADPAGAMFEMFLDLLRSVHGPNLLRLKGIVKLAETPGARWSSTACSTSSTRRCGCRMADGEQHPPRADHRDLDPAAVKRLFDAFWAPAPRTSPTARR